MVYNTLKNNICNKYNNKKYHDEENIPQEIMAVGGHSGTFQDTSHYSN